MDKDKVIYYLENSFISNLLSNPSITDISFNGRDIYYVSNVEGRKKSDIQITDSVVRDFIRQIANICDAQFSFSSPYLDLSVGKYRINAVHHAIAKVQDEGVVTFSIRIASSTLRINDNSDFLSQQLLTFINALIKHKSSIVIAGVTSSGKTEFQKYLLSKLKNNERVIVIDNVLELDSVRNDDIDLTCWKSNDDIPLFSASNLIRNALRNNPDWIVLAESRGKEMVDVVNSSMTGMPIITTIHAKDVFAIPNRMGRMMMQSEQKIDYGEALKDIYYHFPFHFFLNKEFVNGKIKRYISQVAYLSEKGKMTLLYQRNGQKAVFYPMVNEILKQFGEEEIKLEKRDE